MCGNFGLLFVKKQSIESIESENYENTSKKTATSNGFVALEREEPFVRNRTVSFGESDQHTDHDGERHVGFAAPEPTKGALRSPLDILEAQAANTEIRGGQAGGYSSLEYTRVKNTSPVAMHPVGETVHSPFRSTHSVGSSTHAKTASTIKANPKHAAAFQQSNTTQSSADTHSPLHKSNHDATVHSYQRNRTMSQTGNFSQFEAEYVTVPHNTRVRTVARKRYPLAADLSKQYLNERKGKGLELDNTFTVIGHTRFATSSANKVSELHPHEWTPFKEEVVWKFNPILGKYERCSAVMGVHITHNGDFDELEAYSQVLVNEEVGYWLARILYSHNPARSDSAKIPGVMELFRVQGRWGPAARLAWIRCIATSSTDVSGGQLLAADAPYSFPAPGFWTNWAIFLEQHWAQHINNVISTVVPPIGHRLAGQMFFYRIQETGVTQLEASICAALADENAAICETLGVRRWGSNKLQSFVHHAVRGFLRGDLYNAVTELMLRAEGSFGLQVHCTLEPGVVIVASKGQPMSIAFDQDTPLVLFASEAEALAVPVRESGQSLPVRVDLDGHGEIVRVGEPRALLEGRFRDREERAAAAPGAGGGSGGAGADGSGVTSNAPTGKGAVMMSGSTHAEHRDVVTTASTATAAGNTNYKTSAYADNALLHQQCLFLRCGVEIRSYILNRHAELSGAQIEERCVAIQAPERPYDPNADLVASDLRDTPAVLNAIDKAWGDRTSPQRIAGHALSTRLVDCMRQRVLHSQDTIDLLLAGVEASLWLAEQFAADLRRIFPYLNVSTVSANKVLGLGDEDSLKVFFPNAEDHLERRISPTTCVLLVSQSGQTFSTLHATHKLASLVQDRLWILTGCSNSKMEFALCDSYRRHGLLYKNDRVIHNKSGHRPAEPSSVAVAATWHTLTNLLMHLVYTTRALAPSGRMVHEWVYTKSARIIQTFFRKHNYAMRKLHHAHASQCNLQSLLEQGHAASAVLVPAAGSTNRGSGATTPAAPVLTAYTHPPVLMRLTDGCIRDLNSLLSTNLVPNICSIVGTDVKGKALDANEIASASAHPNMLQSGGAGGTGTGKGGSAGSGSGGRSGAAELVSDLLAGKERDNSVHQALVAQGRKWAEHVNEPWKVLVIAGLYIFLSVALGLPICGLIADALVKILRAMGAPVGQGLFIFSLRHPEFIYAQYPGWTVCGLLLQICDALFFVYIGKNLNRVLRIINRRPLYARFGKRTLVIVDNPTVHQLLENYVSKLYSQAYSVVSLDVHGASGLDHFVHRFTHRVVRGVLIAVGRVDGRLCCLAKSEASTLLAVKQAAFIRNPDYDGDGSGPDIVTVGHNPFVPNLGVAAHVVLNSVTTSTPLDNRPSKLSLSRILKLNAARGGALDKVELAVLKTTNTEWKRHRFLDMYLYNRLYFAEKPFTKAILKSLRYSMEYEFESRRLEQQRQLQRANAGTSTPPRFKAPPQMGAAVVAAQHLYQRNKSQKQHMALSEEVLPYGVHHIDPAILQTKRSSADSSFLEFVLNNTQILKKMKNKKSPVIQNRSSDPAMILAFTAKLDARTKAVIDRQVFVQQLYECRIASLERYVAFCVMFHAMADASCRPWLKVPWNVSRSQSNLRVATTASPISASGAPAHDGPEVSRAVLAKSRRAIGALTRKVQVNF